MREVRQHISFKFGFGSWHLAFGNAWGNAAGKLYRRGITPGTSNSTGTTAGGRGLSKCRNVEILLYSLREFIGTRKVERENNFGRKKSYQELSRSPTRHSVAQVSLSERLNALPRLHAHKGGPSRDHREQRELAARDTQHHKSTTQSHVSQIKSVFTLQRA